MAPLAGASERPANQTPDFVKHRFDDPALRSEFQAVLRDTYFKHLSDEFLLTPEGVTDLNDHVFERYHRTLYHYIPWVSRVHPLGESTVIEVGCGTGSSTAAFARFAKHVHAYETADASVSAAQARMRIMGITNTTIIRVDPEDLLAMIVARHPAPSAILLFAVLEHMTIGERLETLRALWEILEPGGILIVAETPNRLTYLDYHTSRLPFFHMLPAELAARYYHQSPRDGFRTAIDEAMKIGFENGIESLTRWGNAVSYHEFELTLGPVLDPLIIADGDSEEMRALYPRTAEEALLSGYFSHLESPKPRAFTNSILNIVFGKPGPTVIRPGHAPRAAHSPEPGTEVDQVRGGEFAATAAPEESVDQASSMLTTSELGYLASFASRDYSGQGAIVDLGCWFGVSSVTLAKGLREHPVARVRSARVHAYDLFLWDAWMDDLGVVRGTPLEGKYRPGESFLEECRRLIEPWKDNIELYPGDLSAIGWSGGPIEFLFVDAMKSWSLANSIVYYFYRALIPGVSVVVQQDFGSFYVYWLHLLTFRFRDYFEPIRDLPCASSVVFKYVRQIPEASLRANYDLASFSVEEIDAAFEYAKGFVGSVKRAQLAAAKVRCYLEKGDRLRADQAFSELAVAIDMHHGILLAEEAKQDQLRQENHRLRTELEHSRIEPIGRGEDGNGLYPA